jgi:flagellar biosynthesis protein FliP
MKHNSTSTLGALHPIMFFIVVYGISLFLALFVCRTIYFGINEKATGQIEGKQATSQSELTAAVSYK